MGLQEYKSLLEDEKGEDLLKEVLEDNIEELFQLVEMGGEGLSDFILDKYEDRLSQEVIDTYTTYLYDKEQEIGDILYTASKEFA